MGVGSTPNRVAGALTVLLVLGVMTPAAPPVGAEGSIVCEPVEPHLPPEFEEWCFDSFPCDDAQLEECLAPGSPQCDLPGPVPPEHVPCVPCFGLDPLVPELPPEQVGCVNNLVLPGVPQVEAVPYIGGGCTGSKNPIAQGTATAQAGGGALIPASVSASVTVTSLWQYTFACDYGMVAAAHGYNSFVRRVRMEVSAAGSPFAPFGPFCGYTGLPANEDCTTEADVLRDAYSGAGVAGPGGVGLPTAVQICPADGFVMRAVNEGWQGLPLYDVTDIDTWKCQDFGIHYVN